MLRCIAIDDESLGLELLEDNIRQVPYLQLVGSFHDPMEAMKVLQEQKVDLVFLDIQMPRLSGLQLIKSLVQKPMFILVTAYERFALEGYALNVVDYLLKPVALERFIQACNKARELHQLRIGSPATGRPPDYLFVNVEYSLLKVSFHDILWVEGLKDYVKIHLKSTAKPVVTRASLKSLEEQLPASGFLRIHKSYLVSTAAVTAIRKTSVFIGSVELPVSESYREAVDAFVRKGGDGA